MLLADPDTYVADRSVVPVSKTTVGEPPEMLRFTRESKLTRTSTATPALIEPSAVVLDTPEIVGAAVSIVTDPETEEDVFPAESDCEADKAQVPSIKVVRSHVDPVVEPLTEQETLLEPLFDAVTVMVPPFSAAMTLIVGVESDVIPSELLEPRSDAVAT